ncbi:hypothetical protein PoB_005304100 [Plakobranchus ocellatus]|uniref:SCP domain-containing protein n=1 Tax=Plakobranchus ocellatus TaxID=259542 RepID=A0AAV4C5A3_9GAST|nr:hypothetical protein PoB_005304100 [Plakobranchus ocellatus]
MQQHAIIVSTILFICFLSSLVSYADMDLEAQAKTWVLGCNFAMDNASEHGQISAFNNKHITNAEKRIIHAKLWFDQKALYTRGQGACGKSCCYTQLILELHI